MKREGGGGESPDSVDDIIKETDHLSYLIGQMLALARADVSESPFASGDIDLSSLAGDVVREAQVLAATPSGWRNARLPDQQVVLRCGAREIQVAYRRLRDGRFRLADGTHARIHAFGPDAIDVEIDARRTRARVTRHGDRLTLHTSHGDVELIVAPRF